MRFGTIGAGSIGQAIASHLVKAGHQVVLSNRRGPASLQTLIAGLGPLASAGTVPEAAAADMVFLAVAWPDLGAALSGLPDWGGRILVDTTNQFDYLDGTLQPVDTMKSFGLATGSEVVASLAPGAGRRASSRRPVLKGCPGLGCACRLGNGTSDWRPGPSKEELCESSECWRPRAW